jgi:hypothetical protein
MSGRHFPVRPSLRQLRQQAKDLLRAVRRGAPEALVEFRQFHPDPPTPPAARLADAQLALARSYGIASWPRLVLACRMTDALCRDDAREVRALVTDHPELLVEDARGVKGNWGPPMSYAANLGRTRIIRMLHELGARDVQFAFERACLQGELDTARLLHGFGARPVPGSVMGPCETQNAEGLAFLLDLGADLADEHGNRLAPVALLLQTYCRNAAGKHACLETVARHGIDLPDTPPMAVHRGRLDLLERHVARDRGVLDRTFAHDEIYPTSLGCDADHSLALHATPIAGGTLLHLCMDFDEPAIARWLVARGADVNARATVDADGFGGHTPLFNTIVTQSGRVREDPDLARLLLDHGADPLARASLRKRLRFVDDESVHEYRDVTPVEWGRRFHDRSFVSRAALALVERHAGG